MFKASKTETKTIRIAKKTNITVKHIFLNNIKQGKVTLLVKKVSHNSDFAALSLVLNIDTNILSKVKTVKLNTTGTFDVRESIKRLKEMEYVQWYVVIKSLREAILYG